MVASNGYQNANARIEMKDIKQENQMTRDNDMSFFDESDCSGRTFQGLLLVERIENVQQKKIKNHVNNLILMLGPLVARLRDPLKVD